MILTIASCTLDAGILLGFTTRTLGMVDYDQRARPGIPHPLYDIPRKCALDPALHKTGRVRQRCRLFDIALHITKCRRAGCGERK